jgi:bacteriorhodopsin
LPAGATASFSPAQVSPGDGSATSTLKVQTAAAAVVTKSRSLGWTLATPALALMLLLPARRWRKKPVRKTLVALAILTSVVATALVLGCGGGFALGKGFTSYTLTITGTSGNDTHSTSVQLTVQ